MEFPSYAVVSGAEWQQGDLLQDCPVLVPAPLEFEVEVPIVLDVPLPPVEWVQVYIFHIESVSSALLPDLAGLVPEGELE